MTEKDQLSRQGELEALFFLAGEPISFKKIANFLQISVEESRKLVENFSDSLKDSERGLVLLINQNEVQLVTKPQFQPLIQKLIQEDFRESLTPAALETLTIIAYLGSMPRSLIDYLRGVNSSYILRNLLMRGLIEKKASPSRVNVYLYQISLEFLKHLGLDKIEDLPEYGKYRDILKKFEIENPEVKNPVVKNLV